MIGRLVLIGAKRSSTNVLLLLAISAVWSRAAVVQNVVTKNPVYCSDSFNSHREQMTFCYDIVQIYGLDESMQWRNYQLREANEWFEASAKCDERTVLLDGHTPMQGRRLLTVASDLERQHVDKLFNRYWQKIGAVKATSLMLPVVYGADYKASRYDYAADYVYSQIRVNAVDPRNAQCIYYYPLEQPAFRLAQCRSKNYFVNGRFSLAICKSYRRLDVPTAVAATSPAPVVAVNSAVRDSELLAGEHNSNGSINNNLGVAVTASSDRASVALSTAAFSSAPSAPSTSTSQTMVDLDLATLFLANNASSSNESVTFDSMFSSATAMDTTAYPLETNATDTTEIATQWAHRDSATARTRMNRMKWWRYERDAVAGRNCPPSGALAILSSGVALRTL